MQTIWTMQTRKSKMEKGLLIVISGPAGSGKGTVTGILTEKHGFVKSVSLTTRSPRPGEVHGKDYYYITHDEFEKRLANDDTLEHTCYCGNYYGTPRTEAENVIEGGKHLILEIEVDGAMQIKAKKPDAVLIMLLPPSFKKQEERLRGRGTETEDKILSRLKQTKNEVALAPKYDYVVYNHDNRSEDCANDILAIVRAEQLAMKRNPDTEANYFA